MFYSFIVLLYCTKVQTLQDLVSHRGLLCIASYSNGPIVCTVPAFVSIDVFDIRVTIAQSVTSRLYSKLNVVHTYFLLFVCLRGKGEI